MLCYYKFIINLDPIHKVPPLILCRILIMIISVALSTKCVLWDFLGLGGPPLIIIAQVKIVMLFSLFVVNFLFMQWRLQEFFSGCSQVDLLCYNFFFFPFKFSITIIFFLDFSSKFFFFSFFFLLESNDMNIVLYPVLVCLMERNISVPIYFDIGCFRVSKKN